MLMSAPEVISVPVILAFNLPVPNSMEVFENGQKEAGKVVGHSNETTLHDLRIFSSGPRLDFIEVLFEGVE